VDKYPFHSLQYRVFRYGVTNAEYFQEMYKDIYPYETGIRIVPNKVQVKPGRLLKCKILDILVFVDSAGKTRITLYDKRDDNSFFVNRFPDIHSNVCRAQLISFFYGEIVRLFRINTPREGFFENTSEVATYLVKYKNYPEEELCLTFSRFLDTQVFNQRLMGTKKDLETIFKYHLTRKLNGLEPAGAMYNPYSYPSYGAMAPAFPPTPQPTPQIVYATQLPPPPPPAPAPTPAPPPVAPAPPAAAPMVFQYLAPMPNGFQ
jgi:hypothetical protein